MQLQEIRNDLGSWINQYDATTDAFLPGFVTEAEADRWINQSYENIYKWYALANSGRFSEKAAVDTVADQAVYTFGGDAEDLLALESVGVKYATTDDDYLMAQPEKPNDFYQTGNEKANENAPRFFERQIYNSSTEHYVLAIEFLEDCIPDTVVTDGLQIRYIARPPLMSEDTDVPEKLPQELHKLLVQGAVIPAFRKMMESTEADKISMLLDQQIKAFFAQEESKTSTGVKKLRRTRDSINKFYRRLR